jgi:hypothetical protein
MPGGPPVPASSPPSRVSSLRHRPAGHEGDVKISSNRELPGGQEGRVRATKRNGPASRAACRAGGTGQGRAAIGGRLPAPEGRGASDAATREATADSVRGGVSQPGSRLACPLRPAHTGGARDLSGNPAFSGNFARVHGPVAHLVTVTAPSPGGSPHLPPPPCAEARFLEPGAPRAGPRYRRHRGPRGHAGAVRPPGASRRRPVPPLLRRFRASRRLWCVIAPIFLRSARILRNNRQADRAGVGPRRRPARPGRELRGSCAAAPPGAAWACAGPGGFLIAANQFTGPAPAIAPE